MILNKYVAGLGLKVEDILTSNTKHKYFQHCIMWHLKYYRGYTYRYIAELMQVSHGYCHNSIENISLEYGSKEPLKVSEIKEKTKKLLSNEMQQRMFKYLKLK